MSSSIELKIQDVNNFNCDVLRIGSKIRDLQGGLTSSLSRVSSYWTDDSITKVRMEISKADYRINLALDRLRTALSIAVRKELEWAERYKYA